MQFWFLSYIQRTKPSNPSHPYETTSNVILAGIHPLVWLSKPADIYGKHYVSIALHFHEIDQATFDELRALNYIGVEDFRDQLVPQL